MQVTNVTPTLGAEIAGIDLSVSLVAATVDRLRQVWLDRKVLIFRDQRLTRDQHKAFGRCFGDLHIHPSHRAGMNRDDDPELFIIDTKADAKQSNGEAWHSDVSCETVPPIASLLYITQVPENGGGDTMFADMALAYAELSEPLKQMLDGKMAFHDGEIDLRNYGFRLKPGQTYPTATHPVVIRHPETALPVLFVNRSFTSHIEALPVWESRMLLEGLYDYVAANARIQCRVKWTPNTLLMWDNRSVQHRAIRDYVGYARYGERVSLSDSVPLEPFRV